MRPDRPMLLEIKRLQQLAGITEIKVNNPLPQVYYVNLTCGRLENQSFVKATSENEALELAKENLEEWGGESDWDEDLTHSEAKLLDLTQNRLKSWDDLDDNHSREEYHMMIYQDENVEDILKKQQGYVWDCGT